MGHFRGWCQTLSERVPWPTGAPHKLLRLVYIPFPFRRALRREEPTVLCSLNDEPPSFP